jgi:hypothetical protein
MPEIEQEEHFGVRIEVSRYLCVFVYGYCEDGEITAAQRLVNRVTELLAPHMEELERLEEDIAKEAGA